MTRRHKTIFDGTREALATFTAEGRQAEGLRGEVRARGFGLTADEPEAAE